MAVHRMRTLVTAIGALFSAVFLPAVAIAQTTVTLFPSRDNTLFESPDGSLSNGSGPSLFAGRTAQGVDAIRRALLQFDVADSVPAGVTIVSVTLQLQVTAQPPDAGSTPFELYAVHRAWGEGGSDTNFGGGAPSQDGDATWRHTFYPSSSWSSEGGDFSNSASGSTLSSGLGALTIGSTSRLVGDVQRWLDAPAGNFGWIFVGGESTPQSVRRFDSREGGRPPELVVSYEEGTPVPGVPLVGLLLLALTLAATGFAVLRSQSPPK